MINLRVHCDPDEADSWQVRGCDIAIQRRAAEAQRHRTIAGLDLKTPAFWTAVTHWRAGGLPRSRNSRPHRASRGSADAGWFHRPPDVGATRGAVMLVAPASRRRWWCTDAGWSYRPRIRKRPLSRSLPLFRTLPSSPAFWSAVTHWRPGAPASRHKGRCDVCSAGVPPAMVVYRCGLVRSLTDTETASVPDAAPDAVLITGLLVRCDALASQRPSVAPSAWSLVG